MIAWMRATALCILGSSWNYHSLKGFVFLFLFIIEKLIPQYFSSNSRNDISVILFSVFLKLELYQLFPCTYITLTHQRTQNNSQKIRVHFVWVH